jgi:hypothetical protein
VGRHSERPSRRELRRARHRNRPVHPDHLRLGVVHLARVPARGISLAAEVELVRAAIPYADEIELVSTGTATISVLARQAGGHQRRHLLPKRNPEHPETWEVLTTRAGGADLLRARDAGVLTLEAFDWPRSSFRTAESADPTAVAWNLVLQPARRLVGDTGARLLIDDRTGDIARLLVEPNEEDPDGITLKRAGDAALHGGLVARLPAFPQAPVDELLDLREDLRGPLDRYRAHVSRLACQLALPSVHPASAGEIEDLWLHTVAPALSELREGFAEHGLVREIARTIGADLKTVLSAGAGAAIFLGMDRLASVDRWVSQGTGPIEATRTPAYRDHGRHDLFYLYEPDPRS